MNLVENQGPARSPLLLENDVNAIKKFLKEEFLKKSDQRKIKCYETNDAKYLNFLLKELSANKTRKGYRLEPYTKDVISAAEIKKVISFNNPSFTFIGLVNEHVLVVPFSLKNL